MKQLVVIIKDDLIGGGNLLTYPNAESAVRSFREVINGDNQIAIHANDHSLVAIGNYDTEKCCLIAFEETRVLAKGKDLANKPKAIINNSNGKTVTL